MNLWSSHRSHENRRYEGSRLRAPRGARRGSSVFFFEISVIDPPRGRPFGGGGVHRS